MKMNAIPTRLRFMHLVCLLAFSLMLAACDSGLIDATPDTPEPMTELARIDVNTTASPSPLLAFSNEMHEAAKSGASSAASKTYSAHFYFGILTAEGEDKGMGYVDPSNPDLEASQPYAGQRIDMTVRDDGTLVIPREEFALSTLVYTTSNLRMKLRPDSDLEGLYAYNTSTHNYNGYFVYRGDIEFDGTYLRRSVSASGQTCTFEDVEVSFNVTFTSNANAAWSDALDDVNATAYVSMRSNGFGLERPTGCESWVYRRLADYTDVASEEKTLFYLWANAREAFLPPGIEPLTASIFGPTRLDSYEQGTWTANVDGGTDPYNYQWQSCLMLPGVSCTWRPVGNNSATLTMALADDTKLKVTATDTRGETKSAYLNVSVDGGDFDDFSTDPRRR